MWRASGATGAVNCLSQRRSPLEQASSLSRASKNVDFRQFTALATLD